MTRTLRGLSLLELLLAMAITIMVAAAITAMLGAVTAGVGNRRDSRAVMVLAHAAQSRLSAYIAPSRCILGVYGEDLAIWLSDDRESGTVHASEVRWLRFDPSSRTITVEYVSFPANWSKTACDLEDEVYAANSDWLAVLADYRTNGWTASLVLIDSLTDAEITFDTPAAIDSRHIQYRLTFDTESGSGPISTAATIRQHQAPTS